MKRMLKKTERDDVVNEIPLPPVVPTAPTVHKFQHGGFPAAAAVLTLGPKGGVSTYRASCSADDQRFDVSKPYFVHHLEV